MKSGKGLRKADMKPETLKARRVRERKEIKMSLLVILGRLTEQKEAEKRKS
jgi:hypothetical protein